MVEASYDFFQNEALKYSLFRERLDIYDYMRGAESRLFRNTKGFSMTAQAL